MFLSSNVLAAAPDMSLEQRVMRLENMLNSQVLVEQTQQMEQMRAELAQLRELVEKQSYELENIKQRQRNLYQDMDRRLNDLETGKPQSPVATTITPPAAVVAVDAGAVSAPAAAGDDEGKALYDKAFNLLKEGRYPQSIAEFKNYLQKYPQGKLTDNAQYWLAEANYVSRDYKTALQEFQKLLKTYPDSNKIRDADLKIGYTYYEMKDWAAARTTLESIISRYPNSAYSKKAEERLQRMKREGH
jgi:tol-pal system protein YbgF